jgi:hypothetical protein
MRAPHLQSPPDTARQALANAFLKRSIDLLARLSARAPSEVLDAALASPTDAGGLALLLSDLATLDLNLDSADPLAEAMARGVTVKQDLLLKAGGALTSTQVAQALGITRQGVDKRRVRGTLLAIPSGSGDYLYPACQFTETGVIDHLDDVLKAMQVESPWTRLSFLLSPAPALGGRTVLEALTGGDVAKSLSLAAAFGEQGA